MTDSESSSSQSHPEGLTERDKEMLALLASEGVSGMRGEMGEGGGVSAGMCRDMRAQYEAEAEATLRELADAYCLARSTAAYHIRGLCSHRHDDEESG